MRFLFFFVTILAGEAGAGSGRRRRRRPAERRGGAGPVVLPTLRRSTPPARQLVGLLGARGRPTPARHQVSDLSVFWTPPPYRISGKSSGPLSLSPERKTGHLKHNQGLQGGHGPPIKKRKPSRWEFLNLFRPLTWVFLSLLRPVAPRFPKEKPVT